MAGSPQGEASGLSAFDGFLIDTADLIRAGIEAIKGESPTLPIIPKSVIKDMKHAAGTFDPDDGA